MKKINKYIEIVSSTDSSLSSMSKVSYDMLQASLSKSYAKVGVTLVSHEEDLDALVEKKPDLVFIGVKKVPRIPTVTNSARFTWVNEYVEQRGILCTGTSSEGLVHDDDKTKAKKVLKKLGISTAPFFMAYDGQYTSKSQIPLPFPLFMKPPNRGAGVGIDAQSVVNNHREYKDKIISLERDFNSEALVETYLQGREFTVAILMDKESVDGEDSFTVLPLEILPESNENGDLIVDYAMKSSAKETETALVTDKHLEEQITELALEAFIAIGARDYGRVDIRFDLDNKAYFLEANLIPSLIEGSGNFQKACQKNIGLNYDDMMLRIVELGFSHPAYVPEVVEPVAAV
jgi:D-alanine-D-alanine ligase